MLEALRIFAFKTFVAQISSAEAILALPIDQKGPHSAPLTQCFVKGRFYQQYLINTIFLPLQRKKDGKTKKIQPKSDKQQKIIQGKKIPWEMPSPVNYSHKLKFKEANQEKKHFLVEGFVP